MKPILFNTEMVRAILGGKKTTTRRVIKPQPKRAHTLLDYDDGDAIFLCGRMDNGACIDYQEAVALPYQPGDILYVRETWQTFGRCFIFKADEKKLTWWKNLNIGKWRPSIFMPKEAARIFLRVIGVKAERLQDMEKVPSGPNNPFCKEGTQYECDFIALWDRTIKKSDLPLYGWDANPWVWVISFGRCEKPKEGQTA